MANAKRRYTYVDFTKEPVTGVFAKTTHAIATQAPNQEDYFRVGEQGAYFEMIQTGANSPVFPVASASGWQLPIGTADGNAMQMTQGIVAGDPTNMKFVTGTDAFFIKCKMEVTVLADTDCVQIGFRELAAYAATTTPALALTDYDHKATMGTNDGAGAVVSMVSTAAGSDTATTATNTPIVTGTAVTWEVRVAADLSVTFYVDGVADTLLNAAGSTLTTGKTLVPTILAVSTGAGAEKVEIASYECGLLPL